MSTEQNTPFTPTMIGKTVSYEHDDSTGTITQETETHIYVDSAFYTGWVPKDALYSAEELGGFIRGETP